MEDEKKSRKKRITLRLTDKEYAELAQNWQNSTIRKLSDFVRRLMFGRRLTVYTRNKSQDELLEELTLLRRELKAIGVNFNQAVHRLNMLDLAPQMQVWLERFRRDRDQYFVMFEEVKIKINSVSKQWLQ